MPQVDYANHLIEYAFEIGIVRSNGTDVSPMTWSDIRDWQSVVGGKLTMWECHTLMTMSKAYAEQYHASNGSIVPPPYQPKIADKAVISQRIGGLLRGLAKRQAIKKSRE